MKAQLTIVRPAETYGEVGHRTRTASAELVAEALGTSVAMSIKRGAVHGDNLELTEPEQVAACCLDSAERRALIAFLSSIPFDPE